MKNDLNEEMIEMFKVLKKSIDELSAATTLLASNVSLEGNAINLLKQSIERMKP